MVHEQHDAACSGQRFKVSKSGQYDFETGIVRAPTVPFNVKIVSFACKGAQTSHLRTWANSGTFSATCASWLVCHTNSMMQLVLAKGLSGLDMGNTNLKLAWCRHVLFKST